jgi:hypothetical protein
MAGSAWDSINSTDLVPDRDTKVMLLSHPLSDDIIYLSDIEVNGILLAFNLSGE